MIINQIESNLKNYTCSKRLVMGGADKVGFLPNLKKKRRKNISIYIIKYVGSNIIPYAIFILK